MSEHIPQQPLDAMDIRRVSSADADILDADLTETTVHYPWFVLSNGSMHPDVYWARRRRARTIGLALASVLAVGGVTAVLMLQRDGVRFPSSVSLTPPAPVGRIATNPPPVAVRPPPPVRAPVPTVAARSPVEVAKPPVEVAKPAVEVTKPPVEVAKPPVAVTKPPVEIARPPVAVTKPPVGVAKPRVEPAPRRVEVTPPRQTAVPPRKDPVRVPLPRPLSQDPARLAAGVPPSSSSSPRAGVEATPAPPPVAAPSASPPPAAPVPSAEAPSPTAVPPPTASPTPAPAIVPAPATVSPAPAAASSAGAAASAVTTNTTGIQNALARYRRAFSSLDANAVRAVWPTVNERTLSRAFERLEQQQVAFDNCQIDLTDSERAEANCSGTARYVPRVGSRTPRVDQRQWRFSLVKVRDQWLIGAVEAR
jgi:hypothetical protein